jgi:hypothetical protein
MLELAKVSPLTPYSPDWFFHRLGKFTGSEMSCLMGYADKDLHKLPKGCITYIKNKVAEVLTGKPSRENITTREIEFGVSQEPHSLAFLSERMGWKLIINKHIIHDERCTVTPDALAVVDETIYAKQQEEKSPFRFLEPVESKSPSVFSKHMEFLDCQNYSDLKAVNSDYSYQCLFQLIACGSTKAHFVSYQPFFPEKRRQAHIVIRAIEKDVSADIKALKTRIELAKKEFDSLLLKFQ